MLCIGLCNLDIVHRTLVWTVFIAVCAFYPVYKSMCFGHCAKVCVLWKVCKAECALYRVERTVCFGQRANKGVPCTMCIAVCAME